MKRILFITIIAVVFILASCTLAPFAYLFGGGLITGGNRPETKDGELVVDLKSITHYEGFQEKIAYFMIFVEGPQNVTEKRVDSTVEEKSYLLKKGHYRVRVYAIDDLDKTIGVFKKNFEIKSGMQEKIVPTFEEAKNLIIRFGDEKLQSRSFSNGTDSFELFVRENGNTDIVHHELINRSNNASQTVSISVAVGKTYDVEVYSLRHPSGSYGGSYNPAEGSSITLESTLVLAYGMNSVEIDPGPGDPSVSIALENFQSSAADKFETVDQNFSVSVTVTFPSTYTSKMLTTSKNQGYMASGEFGGLLLHYATESSVVPETKSMSYDVNHARTAWDGVNNLVIATFTNHTNKFFFEASETVWYWFTATDTNNRTFLFPSEPATVVVESGKNLDVIITQ